MLKPYDTFHSAGMTLKIRSRSPKPNQLFLPSQQCIYASLVKMHLLAQKIMNRNKETQIYADMDANADETCTKTNMSPTPPSVWRIFLFEEISIT